MIIYKVIQASKTFRYRENPILKFITILLLIYYPNPEFITTNNMEETDCSVSSNSELAEHLISRKQETCLKKYFTIIYY